MRTIPEIRDRMIQMADEHGLPELKELAEQTRRRRPIRRAPSRRKNPDNAEAEHIRAFAASHPRADYQEIASRFGTNIGRISEVLSGKRGDA